MGESVVGKTVSTIGKHWIDALAHNTLKEGISPRLLKGNSLVLYGLGGLLLAMGSYTQTPYNWIHALAGVVILLANLFALLDQTVGTLIGKTTKFRALAESLLNRYADIVIFAGALTYFALRHDPIFVVISAIAVAGVLMSEYTCARAEALLPGNYNAGYLKRPERMVIVMVTSLSNRVYMGMILIAILANLATLHRLRDARQTALNLEYPKEARRSHSLPDAHPIVQFFQKIIFWNYPRQSWQYELAGLLLFMLVEVAFFFFPER